MYYLDVLLGLVESVVLHAAVATVTAGIAERREEDRFERCLAGIVQVGE